MSSYKRKDDAALAFQATAARIRTEGRIVLNRVLNEALAEAGKQHDAKVKAGSVPDIRLSDGELEGLLLKAAVQTLAPTQVVSTAEELTDAVGPEGMPRGD